MASPIASFSNFEELDIRSGVIISAVPAQSRKPTYRMTIDFGPDIGQKVSCGAYTNYKAADIVGKTVIAVVNFGPKRLGPEVSEALVLGVADPESDGTIFLTLDKPAPAGSHIF